MDLGLDEEVAIIIIVESIHCKRIHIYTHEILTYLSLSLFNDLGMLCQGLT